MLLSPCRLVVIGVSDGSGMQFQASDRTDLGLGQRDVVSIGKEILILDVIRTGVFYLFSWCWWGI